jgi:hypothetical protein
VEKGRKREERQNKAEKGKKREERQSTVEEEGREKRN